MGFSDLPVLGSEDVRLTQVKVTGVAAGLSVVKVGAVSVRETNPSGGRHTIGALTEDILPRGYPNLRIHPITDAVIKPGRLVDWYVVVVVAATRGGDYTTSGLHILYMTASGQSGAVDYPYRIHIHTLPSGSS